MKAIVADGWRGGSGCAIVRSMSDEILFDEAEGWGVVTLNAPGRLNALSHAMCRDLGAQLARWRDDGAIRAVMLKAAGDRAFCAGGDIRALYEARRGGDTRAPVEFFADEYRTNWRVARFPKPYVSLIDGAVMGGGVGISVHGRYRVATERALFAMPECGIGLYPDVGTTHVLPRLVGSAGMWMGLTGARLGQGDMLGLGLATHTVPSGALAQVEARLRAVDWRDGAQEAVEAALDACHEVPDAPTPAIDARHEIRSIFGKGSVEAIVAALEAQGGDWAGEQLAAIRRGAPLSLKVTHRALTLGARLDITHALRMEFALTRRFIETGAMLEGIRAQIIDKDRNPRWPHPALESVTDAEVAAMFEPAADTPDFGWETDP